MQTHRLTLDLVKERRVVPDVLTMRVGEGGSQTIEAEVVSDGSPWQIPEGARSELCLYTARHAVRIQTAEGEGSRLTITLDDHMLADEGTCALAYFRVVADGAAQTTEGFTLRIIGSVVGDDEPARSWDELRELAIEEWRAFGDRAEAAEAARASAEMGREGAESGRKAAELKREEAESARVLAEGAREEAESARVLAEGAREEAEGKRNANENNRVKAENQRRADEMTRKRAEEQRRADETVRRQNEVGRVELDLQRTAQQEKNNADQARNNELASGIPWEYLDDPSQYDPDTGMPTIPEDEVDGRKLYSTPAPTETEDDARTEWQWRQLGDGTHRWEKIGSNTGKMPDPISTDDVDSIVDGGTDLQSANLVNGTILSYYTTKVRAWMQTAGSIAKLAVARMLTTRLDSDAQSAFDGSADAEIGVTGILPPAHGGTGQDLAATDPEQLEEAQSAARATLGIEERTMFLLAHPVGDYWFTSSDTDPNVAYGGTWERVKDRFIWAKGDNDEIGATGGAKTVALTVAQMPAHSHTVNSHTHAGPSHTHTLKGFRNSARESGGTTLGIVAKDGSGTGSSFGGRVMVDTPSLNDATNTSKGTPTTVASGTGNTGAASPGTTSVGGGAAHENMPPYLAAYCWHRTA